MTSPGGAIQALRAVGRAFWFGLAISLALHAFFIAAGRFPKAQMETPQTLEARLEPEAFDAIAPPAPEIASTPAKPAAAQHPPHGPRAPEPLPPMPVPPLMAPANTEFPMPPEPEPVLPSSEAKPPPATSQPHDLLAGAAERIRNLPARIEIVYELNGMLSGRQTHVWQLDGQRYTLESEGEVTGLAGLFVRGKMIQKSRGRVGSLGLMPERYEMLRLSGKKENLRFDYAANLIESNYGKRALELPLLTGAQDPLSSIYQLAMAARGDRDGFIVAASAKRVRGYPYRTLGTETLRTALGEMKTLHVARAGDSDKGAVHLWLAPERHYLPVKVRYVDEDGTEWVLEAVSVKAQ